MKKPCSLSEFLNPSRLQKTEESTENRGFVSFDPVSKITEIHFFLQRKSGAEAERATQAFWHIPCLFFL